MAVVLRQEVARFNRLHQVVQQSLQGLVEALQGHAAMTPELMSVHHALSIQQVLVFGNFSFSVQSLGLAGRW